MASSRSGLYGMILFTSIPQFAVMIALGAASLIRTASSCGANPPKTTELTAPIRAQASIAISASVTIGF